MVKKSQIVLKGEKFPRIVYGLNGIQEIFNVSKATAFNYRHGILKDACTQNGNVIIVDTLKALKLFGIPNPSKFVNLK